MEIKIYSSPWKYRIVAIKDYLMKNNIPIASIKLCLCLYLKKDLIERHDELNIPIEEFNEELNESQVFEIYIDEKHEEDADKLFEDFDDETFFNDCIYKSNNYDEVFEIYQLLKKNNLQCDDIFTITDIYTNVEEHLLFLDPDKKEEALKIINGENRAETYEYQEIKPKEVFVQEDNESNIFRYIILSVIILFLLLFFIKIDNESILAMLVKKIIK